MQVTTQRDSDEQLVERVQRGDKRAFDLLVIKYQHKVMSLISRYVSDSAEVQDVAQDAFIKAYRAIGRFRGDSQFYTWLYRIAANTAKNYLVSRGRRPPGSDIDAEEAEFLDMGGALKDVDSPEENIAAEELREVVEQTIKALPEDLRMALSLREYDGLSYEEIAVLMDCPVGTVRSRIFRAREAVDQQVTRLMSGEI
jgi:RNA polymerase sigma-70 factor (ECF subfamily)